MTCIHALFLAAALLFSHAALAAGVGISPMRLVFDAGRGFGQVTLSNTSQETLAVEAQVVPWPADADGQTARDVVVNPPMATLAPGARITLRVALLRRPAADRERAYRLYVTELPAPLAPGVQAIGVRLRVGIPLFVAAAAPQTQPLVWRLQADEQGPLLVAHNPGNVHQRVHELRVGDGEGLPAPVQGSPYVLPGSHATFRLPALARPLADGEPLTLRLQTDHGRERVELARP